MTATETKFAALVATALKKGKLTAPQYNEIGFGLGMTCRQVADAKKLIKGKPVPAAKVKASAPSATKKPTKVKKAVPATEPLADLKAKYGTLVADEPQVEHGVVVDTADEFVWIASPTEIASTEDLHSTDY